VTQLAFLPLLLVPSDLPGMVEKNYGFRLTVDRALLRPAESSPATIDRRTDMITALVRPKIPVPNA
jgi:hypothetical protein